MAEKSQNAFFQKLKTISPGDIGHIFLFLFALLPAALLRARRPHIWLFCEYSREARDNGYWLYKYVRENHPERDALYAIDCHAPDYPKVSVLGETVQYGTLRHWIYYLAAEINISSQKGGKPNAAVCYLLEVVLGILKNKRVFLQHGIIMHDIANFYYKNTKMRLFICGAKPEFDYISEHYGYPSKYVQYTGLARFDALRQHIVQKKQILVAPTWRLWLHKAGSEAYSGSVKGIAETQYYREWTEFLYKPALAALLREYGYTLILYPHRSVFSAFSDFHPNSAEISIADWRECDLQVLMRESALLLTDYSSVAMDFAYLRKPLIYFQFDYERFRQTHLRPGYFSYDADGFGPVCSTGEDTLGCLETIIKNGCQMPDHYQARIDSFFELNDGNNCERNYQAIAAIGIGE